MGLSVIVFQSHQKSQGHEMLALRLIWANLKYDEAEILIFKGAILLLTLISAIWGHRLMKICLWAYFSVPSNMQKVAFQNFDF